MPPSILIAWLPLASAIVWTGLGVYQVARDRFRTWTEVFLVGTFLLVGVYALSDFLFYQIANTNTAEVAAKFSLSFLALAAVFFFLYAIVLYSRMRRILFLSFVPAIAMLFLIWTAVVPNGPAATDWPHVVAYLPLGIGAWSAYMVVYCVLGIGAFGLTLRGIQQQTVKIAKRMRVLLAAILSTFILGFVTTSVVYLLEPGTPPLFSTLLVVPGALAFVAVSPLAEGSFSLPIHRWKARSYDIRAVFLTYRDGTLIGSRARAEDTTIDQDLVAATLDVIQNFMRTSFPFLEGKWLRSISHGDYTLVIERGRSTYLTVVLQGRETDQLRRQMRDGLLEFEAENRRTLRDWQGFSGEAFGADTLLAEIMGETAGSVALATPASTSSGTL